MTFGAANSRIKALSYPRIFIPCDIASLLLQAAGGGLASAASHKDESVTTGDNILVAGLAFQVLTLLIFMCLAVDFANRTVKRMRELGEHEALDPTHAKLRASPKFRAFLGALSLATICIFTRSVFRVVELGEGWTGHLIRDQKLFIALEGAMVVLAVLALNVFHPGLCFREGYVREEKKPKTGGRTWFGKKRTAATHREKHGATPSPEPEQEAPVSGIEKDTGHGKVYEKKEHEV